MNCPNCGAPMALFGGRPAWECSHCGTIVRMECSGLLMPLSLFGITILAKRRGAMTPAVTPMPGTARDLQRVVDCPSCGSRMITDWYYGPGNAVIDRCESCDLVWLDGGELQRVIDAPGPDRLA